MIKHIFSASAMADIIACSKPSIPNWINSGKLVCSDRNQETGKYSFTIDNVRANIKCNTRKRSIVTTFGNQKGGVGKTTIVIFMAITAAEFGYRILVIDTDKQGNLSEFFLDAKPSPTEVTIYNVFKEDHPDESVIRKSNFKNIHIIPANLKFGDIKNHKQFETFFKLREYLNIYKSNYDFVFIDTQPDIDLPTEAAIIASDYVIGVTDPDTWGIQGFIDLRNKTISIKDTNNPTLKIPGFIFNGVLEHRRLDRELLEFAKDSLDGVPRIKAKLPLVQGYKEAINEKRSVFEKDISEKYKDLLIDLSVEVLGVLQ